MCYDLHPCYEYTFCSDVEIKWSELHGNQTSICTVSMWVFTNCVGTLRLCRRDRHLSSYNFEFKPDISVGGVIYDDGMQSIDLPGLTKDMNPDVDSTRAARRACARGITAAAAVI